MNLENIVIVPKKSKYDFDKKTYGMDDEELLQKYEKEGVDVGRILQSHEAQQKVINSLHRFFPQELYPGAFIQEELATEQVKDKNLIIAVGGDNHLMYVSHFLDDQLLIGINSDPKRSEGALINHDVYDVEIFLKKIEKGDYKVEEWTRLQAMVDGYPASKATGDYFLGERARKNMSHHIMEWKGKEEEQKCSGLLVATGAGSSGWYSSEHPFRYYSLLKEYIRFPKTDKQAKFLVTSPYEGKLTRPKLTLGVLEEGDELIIHSLNDKKGILSPDSFHEHPFPRGATARISIHPQPLRVVKLNEN